MFHQHETVPKKVSKISRNPIIVRIIYREHVKFKLFDNLKNTYNHVKYKPAGTPTITNNEMVSKLKSLK